MDALYRPVPTYHPQYNQQIHHNTQNSHTQQAYNYNTQQTYRAPDFIPSRPMDNTYNYVVDSHGYIIQFITKQQTADLSASQSPNTNILCTPTKRWKYVGPVMDTLKPQGYRAVHMLYGTTAKSAKLQLPPGTPIPDLVKDARNHFVVGVCLFQMVI